MRRLALTLVTVLACNSGDADDKKNSPKAPQDQDQPQTTTPEPAAPAPRDESLKEHMKGHFTAISQIERALVDGDLEAAKGQAKWLAEHQPHDAVEAWDPHLKAVEEAAVALTQATDIAGASKLAAALGSECAACHLTTTAISSFPYMEPPAEGKDNKSMMKRHQWAVDRMWEGLIGPSESSWAQGSEMLAKAPFMPQVTLLEDDRKKVEALSKQVHDIAKRATAEEDAAARSGLYAELLTTCSGCHGIARKR